MSDPYDYMYGNLFTTTSPQIRWTHQFLRDARNSLLGLPQLSSSDVTSGVGTGCVATTDALTFGLSGRAANAAGWDWYERQRQAPGFATSRGLAVFGRDLLLAAGGEAWMRRLPWSYGAVGSGKVATTGGYSGAITVQTGLEGEALTESVLHEQWHSAMIRLMPPPLRGSMGRLYNRGGLYTYLEEAAAELHGTWRPFHSLAYPFAEEYIEAVPFVADLFATTVGAGIVAAGRRWWGHQRGGGTPSGSPSQGTPRQSDSGAMSSYLIAGPVAAAGPTAAMPPPTPMDTVRNLFRNRLGTAGWSANASAFVIDGVTVMLRDGDTTAMLDGHVLFLREAPEIRRDEMSLTRSAADQIEAALKSAVEAISIRSFFGWRIHSASATASQSTFQIDGVLVELTDGNSVGRAGQRYVDLGEPARRVNDLMTLGADGFRRLERAIEDAKRQAEPVRLWPPPSVEPPSSSGFLKPLPPIGQPVF